MLARCGLGRWSWRIDVRGVWGLPHQAHPQKQKMQAWLVNVIVRSTWIGWFIFQAPRSRGEWGLVIQSATPLLVLESTGLQVRKASAKEKGCFDYICLYTSPCVADRSLWLESLNPWMSCIDWFLVWRQAKRTSSASWVVGEGESQGTNPSSCLGIIGSSSYFWL